MRRGDNTLWWSRRGLLRGLRGREDAFAFALLVQLAAFVVGPAVHLATHQADHTHGPDGLTHTHGAPARRGGTPTPPPFHDGQGAAMHFGLALTSVPVFFWAFGIALTLVCRWWRPVELGPTRTLFDVASPRGPPVVLV